jgi:predicted metal-dependent phosphotriesterase family hydrolase
MAATGLSTACTTGLKQGYNPIVMTVAGPIRPQDMGITLPHEHVLVDFIGAAGVNRDRYNANEVFATALPHLQNLRQLGARTLVECTPAYLGRDPALLKRLAEASQIQVLTNTGYYGATQNKFLPAHAFSETEDELARRWLSEWRDGIENTGIKPGFVKIGVDAGKLSDIHRKLVRAAARTHLASGLPIAAHTGNGIAALDELATLKVEGVDGSAFIWVHAQNESDSRLHLEAAEKGAWIEFDGLSPDSLPKHLELVTAMKKAGFGRKVLLSHDAGWYHVGEVGGGQFRPYSTLFQDFVPALQKAGFTDPGINQLLAENPRQAFTIRVRRLL